LSANQEDQTKDQSQSQSAAAAPDAAAVSATDGAGGSSEEEEGGLSLESLDQVIAEADPQFANKLGDIAPDALGDGKVNLDDLLAEPTAEDEAKRWSEDPGLRGKLTRIFPFLPRLFFRLHQLRYKFWALFKASKIKAKNLAVAAGPWALARLKASVASIKAGIGAGLGEFKSYSLLKKLGFVVFVVFSVGSLFTVYTIYKKGIVPEKEELFIPSLENWANKKYIYDRRREVETFYDSTRFAQNIVLLPKIVVNIRRSPGSGANPMAAFELYAEGMSAEVVVEMKDREVEVKDLFSRVMEEMTFDQLDSVEGKQLLAEKLRREINRVLTTGLIRRVMIKTAIIKP